MPKYGTDHRTADGVHVDRREVVDEDAQTPVPDEHTRLLPNRVNSVRGEAFLAPDDPAVSPYNLWSVRILRYLTVLFTLLTIIWWLILLVSVFSTPPGFSTRGSGFYAFGFAGLTLANVLFTLLFFGIPSKSVRVLAVSMSLLLALDTILILAVQKTRYEEGWVGTVSVVWALLMSLWTLITDRTVKWGKEEEEERLTGRAETRRTVLEWSAVMLSTVAYSIMTVAVVLMTLTLMIRALDASVAPPGKLYWVDSDKYRVHVYCNSADDGNVEMEGRKAPTVLFEASERTVEYDFWGFAENALKNGSIPRYCFVDRPGYAWSDTAPSPSSAGFVVDAVSEALSKAGENGPWVLAGAGMGSIYSRVFSARHAGRVRGLLLIDPLHEDLLDGVAASWNGFWLWFRGMLSPLGLERLPGAIFRGRTGRDRVYGRSAQQTGKFIFAKLQESLVAGSFTKRDAESSRGIQEKQTPLAVISSGNRVKRSELWEQKQRDLTTLTDKLVSWDIVDGAPHEVWSTFEGRQKIEARLKELVHGQK